MTVSANPPKATTGTTCGSSRSRRVHGVPLSVVVPVVIEDDDDLGAELPGRDRASEDVRVHVFPDMLHRGNDTGRYPGQFR